MKKLYSGLIVFIINVGFLFAMVFTKSLDGYDYSPWWFKIILVLFTILYLNFGYKTIKYEKHYLAGTLYIVLALITLFILEMTSSSII